MKSIKFSVVGVGRIGRRHAKIIQEYEHSELVSITDIDPESLEQASSLDIKATTYASIADFLKKDQHDSDVVCVCTPNGLHTDYGVQLLEAGYHVVIEKPMGISKEGCLQVVGAQESSGKRVFVVKQNRYSPPSAWMKQVVADGLIGNVLMVQVNCYWNRDERYYEPNSWRGTKELDGGALFTQFSHFVDIMHWVFGDIRNPKSIIKNFTHPNLKDFDDSGFAQFEFVKGGIGSINYSTSCWDQNMESSITVVGTEGSFKIGGQYMNEIEYCHIKDYEMPKLKPTNPPNDYGPFKGSAANHHYVIENVVETLNGQSEATANAFEGMKVVSIIEDIYNA